MLAKAAGLKLVMLVKKYKTGLLLFSTVSVFERRLKMLLQFTAFALLQLVVVSLCNWLN